MRYRGTRPACWIVCLSIVAGSLLLGTASRGSASPRVHVAIERVTVNPRVVAPYAWANVQVTGLPVARTVEVRLAGASGISGALLPWHRLHRDGSTWTARLPQPVLAGIYPIELRARPAHPIKREGAEYLRVYWAGTNTRPLFPSPEGAVEWWVQHIGGRLVAIRQWPGTAIDHRLARLHRLYVVAYTPRTSQATQDPLGAWITTVREGDIGGWRVLEVGDTPP